MVARRVMPRPAVVPTSDQATPRLYLPNTVGGCGASAIVASPGCASMALGFSIPYPTAVAPRCGTTLARSHHRREGSTSRGCGGARHADGRLISHGQGAGDGFSCELEQPGTHHRVVACGRDRRQLVDDTLPADISDTVTGRAQFHDLGMGGGN